jgi:uncharacterized protein (DUF4415 family)
MRAKSKLTPRESGEVVVVEIDTARAVPMSDMDKVDRHVITREEYEEIPELPRSWFESADFRIGDKLIRRGRPPKPKKKVAISIRLSEDVLEAFKFCGPGWQTRIDEALAQWLEEHPAAAPNPAPALKRASPRKRAAPKPVTAPAPSSRAGSTRSSRRPRQAP